MKKMFKLTTKQEMQMNTKYHFFLHLKLAKFKKNENAYYWQRPGETGFFWHSGGSSTWAAFWKECWPECQEP